MLTALEKLPADRFGTAAEFADALKDKSYQSTVSLEGGGASRAGQRGRTGRRMPGGAGGGARRGGPAVADGRRALGLAPSGPPQPLTQFSLALRADQALQAARLRAVAGGSRSRRMVAFTGLQRAGGWRVPSPGPANRPAHRHPDGRAPKGAASPFFSPDEAGRVHQKRNHGAHRLDRGRPDGDAHRQGELHRRRLGDDGYVYFEGDSGIIRMRPTGGAVEPVYNNGDEGTRSRRSNGLRFCPVPAASSSG